MSETPAEFTVVTWNILFYDHPQVPPQLERYQDCANTLQALGRSLDVVALCETEDTFEHGNLGAKIAESTGNEPGFWASHSRQNEAIGMFGRYVSEAKFVTLDSDKTAVITQLGSVSIVGVHLTFDIFRSKQRIRQVEALLTALAASDQAVIMGDFNSLPWQKPRKLLEENGYQSVFKLLGRKQPPTAPTKAYRPLLKRWERALIGKGLAADDIYVKGLSVKQADVFEGASDHYGICATLVNT